MWKLSEYLGLKFLSFAIKEPNLIREENLN